MCKLHISAKCCQLILKKLACTSIWQLHHIATPHRHHHVFYIYNYIYILHLSVR